MLELSDNTIKKVGILFPEHLQDEAKKILNEDCGTNLPFCENSDKHSMERIRFAAIKLSNGDLEKLVDAVVLAQTDWRDLLVAADFAEDINAHRRWNP